MTLEELQQQILDLQEKQNSLQNENEIFKTQLSEKDKKISDLSTINQKLFLRVTSPSKEEEDNKKDEYEPLSVSKEFYSKLDDEMKDQLRHIEEEFN